MRFRGEVDTKRLLRRLRKVGDTRANARATSRAFLSILARHDRDMKQNRFTRFDANAPRSRRKLQNRSGQLRRSIGFRLQGQTSLATLKGVAFVASPYARIQEKGGTVRPKRKQFLTIPLPGILTRAGNVRGAYVLRRTGRRYVTDRGPVFIQKSRKGNRIVFLKMRNGRLKPLYVLKRSVKIPPRLGFFDTWRRRSLRFARLRLRLLLNELVTA